MGHSVKPAFSQSTVTSPGNFVSNRYATPSLRAASRIAQSPNPTSTSFPVMSTFAFLYTGDPTEPDRCSSRAQHAEPDARHLPSTFMPISVFATSTLPARDTSYASGFVHRRISFFPSGETALIGAFPFSPKKQQPANASMPRTIQFLMSSPFLL